MYFRHAKSQNCFVPLLKKLMAIMKHAMSKVLRYALKVTGDSYKGGEFIG